MKRWNLNRVVTHAVQYALISGLSACSTSSLRDDTSKTGSSNNDDRDASTAATDTNVATTADDDESVASDDAHSWVTDEDTTALSEGTTKPSTDDTVTAPDHDAATTDDTSPDGGTTTDATESEATADGGTTVDPTDAETTADSGASDPAPGDSNPLACPDAEKSVFDHMQLTSAYDSVALRVTQEGPLDEPPVETEQSGVHCSGAGDVDACLTLVESTWPTSNSAWQRCGQIVCRSYGVLTTRGDEVALAESLDAILALLGSIDTPHEASLWAQANDYDATCGRTTYQSTTSGVVLEFEQMISECPVTYAKVNLQVAPDGTLKELSRVELPETGVCIGRRPPGMLGVNAPCSGLEVGDYFAEVAALENAAVEAFEVVRSHLARFGAPQALQREAERAQADEVRHAQQMGALAVRYGATPAKHRSESRHDQTLLEFALDNAVEGCVRETFGAACAAFQAVKASDPVVRATLRQVAVDETRHAELSWNIHSWVERRLNAEERDQLAEAMRTAVRQLQVEVTRAHPASVRLLGGTPGPADAAALLEDLHARLWAPALAA